MNRSLESLPTELLSQITSYLTASEVTRLWICGDKHLQSALGTRGGALQLHLRPPELLHLFWPSIVRHFSCLQSFDLSDYNSSPTVRITRQHLEQLPRTMRILRLDARGSFLAFQEASLPNSWPHLHTLELHDDTSNDHQGRATIHWPKSLTQLFVTHISLPLDLVSLPPGLEVLSGDFYTNEDQDVPQMEGDWPKSLCSVFLTLNASCCIQVFPLFSKLEFLEALVIRLPPEQDHLEMTFEGGGLEVDLRLLPRSVKELSLPIKVLTRAILEALSDRIERFTPSHDSIGSFRCDNQEALISSWPVGLQSASGMVTGELSKEAYASMPYSVTDVPLVINAACIPHLKPKIASVRCLGSVSSLLAELRALDVPKLSSGLTSLAMLDRTAMVHEAEAQEFVLCLPETSLTSLHVASVPLTSSTLVLLPQHLKVLIVQKHPIATESWKLLPRTLETLHMLTTTHSLKASHVRNLPKTLRALKLELNIVTRIENLEWPHELNSLELALPIFRLKSNSTWPSTLPPLLDRFYIQLRYIDVQPLRNILASLPREITSFSVSVPHPKRDFELNNSDLLLLPKRKLLFLNLPSSPNINSEAAKMIPKSLQSLLITGRRPQWFTPYLDREHLHED